MLDQQARWRSPDLGTPSVLDLGGPVRCFESGRGPAVAFVQRLVTNATRWPKVVPRVGAELRCIPLDLPLGSHELPFGPEADLTPPALADLVTGAIEALGLEDVTLVGNDTGGALCQIAVTRHPG